MLVYLTPQVGSLSFGYINININTDINIDRLIGCFR